MGLTNDEMLKDAAQRGDIDLLYTVIQNDHEVLQNIDLKSFIQTPLHTAAFEGHVKFATEIMRLKPSFAWKLNQQGLSPIHLAMQNSQKMMVKRFVHVDTNLIRVKGREGWTPLHLASQTGQIDLLDIFLNACPDSIQDVTVSCETALHIAVKNEQFEALQLMVGWLKTTQHRGSIGLKRNIINWKDEAGNTILHIAASKNYLNYLQAAEFLVKKSKMDLNAKNLENKTALDMAANEEIMIMLSKAGEKCCSSITDACSSFFAHLLRKSQIATIGRRILIWTFRFQNETTEEQRNVLLIIATLVATATYQSMLSPPGGVFQANAGDDTSNVNMTTSSNSTAPDYQRKAGKSVSSLYNFTTYSLWNTFTYLLSIFSILILSPRGYVGLLVVAPVMCFTYGYTSAVTAASPSQILTVILSVFCGLASFCYLTVVLIGIHIIHNRIKFRFRNSSGGTIW